MLQAGAGNNVRGPWIGKGEGGFFAVAATGLVKQVREVEKHPRHPIDSKQIKNVIFQGCVGESGG
jgi:hypothetical protein